MVKRGVLSVAGAIVAVLVVRWVALALIDVPPEFLPLAGPSAAGFFTTALGIAAVVVYAVVRRFAKRPERTFRWISVGVLVVSFVPDLWLLSEGGSEQFEGATPAGVAILVVLHVVAAAVIVPGLTLGAGREPSS
jgi:hypothetical protein